MSVDLHIDRIEYADLPAETAEAAMSALAFVHNFHEFMKDYRMVSGAEVDTDALEKAFDLFVGEHTAACIFLASFQGVEEKLLATHKKLLVQESVPGIVTLGYKKLAERVARTKESFTVSTESVK